MAREELSIGIKADDQASKVLGQVSDEVGKLEGKKVEIPVGVDATGATRDIDGLLEKVDKLKGTESANLLLTSNASAITTEIAGLVVELDTLDANDPKVDITVANIASLEGDLGRIADKAKEINQVDPKVEISADDKASGDLDRVESKARSVDGMSPNVEVTATGLDDLIGKLDSLPGKLGEITGLLGGLGGAGGIGALAAALGLAATAQADMAVDAQVTADLTGATVGEASKLQGLWKQTGADVNDLNDVMLQMNGVLEAQPELAESLGIDRATDLASQFVQMMDLAAQGQLTTFQQSQLFGEEGVRQAGKMQTLFGEISDDLEDMDPPIDDEDVAKALEFKEAVTEMATAFKAISSEYAKDLVSIFGDLGTIVDKVTEAMPGGKTGADVAGFFQDWGTGLGVISNVLDKVLGDSEDKFGEFTGGDFGDDFGPAVEDNIVAPLQGALAAANDFEARVAGIGAATEAATAAAAESAKALAEAYDDAALAMLSMEPDEGFDRAIDQLNKLSELDFAAMAINTVESFDTIKDALKEAEEAGADWSKVDFSPESVDELKGIPDELQAVTDAVIGMRGTIQTELAAAFDVGGVQGFVDKAGFFAQQITDQFLPIFQQMTGDAGLAQQKVNELLDELGLLPTDVTVALNVTREQQAMAALEAFDSFISGLPEEKEIAIRTAIASGDIETAYNLLNAELINRGYPPIVLPIEGDATGAENAISGVVTLADGSTATVTVDGNVDPANGAIAGVITYADGTTAMVTIDGDPNPADGKVEGVVTLADGSTATVTVDANVAPAEGGVQRVITFADGSTGVVTIDGDPDPATGKTEGVVAFIDGSTGTVVIDGDPALATGKVDGVITYADGSTGEVTIDANDDDARRKIAALIAPKTVQVYVNVNGAGRGELGLAGDDRSVNSTSAMAMTAAPTTTGYVVPAQTAMPPIYINVPAPQPSNVTVQAGVIGNRFDVDRVVAKALRRHQRFNGQRA